MDDSLSAPQFTRVIEREMYMQSEWLKDLDLSNARPLPSDVLYRSSSLTQQPLDRSGWEPAKTMKPARNMDQYLRARGNMGFVYPSLSEMVSKDDIRPKPTIFECHYSTLPEVFQNKESYPNGHKLEQDTYRFNGVFRAVLEK